MKATARPSPSAITHALVPEPPRERPSASRSSRPLLVAPFFPRPPPCGEPECWCRPETSSRVEPHALGPGAAAAPTRPGGPSGGRSEPLATRDQAQPGWRATWPRSDAARQWPKSCAAGPGAGSCPWGGMSRSAAPGPSMLRPSASPPPHSRRSKTPGISPPISCCGTPELREGLQCLEQVGDAPQAAGEPGCHAAQDTLGLLVRASAFSGRGMVEGIPLAGGDGEVERECHDQDQPG